MTDPAPHSHAFRTWVANNPMVALALAGTIAAALVFLALEGPGLVGGALRGYQVSQANAEKVQADADQAKAQAQAASFKMPLVGMPSSSNSGTDSTIDPATYTALKKNFAKTCAADGKEGDPDSPQLLITDPTKIVRGPGILPPPCARKFAPSP